MILQDEIILDIYWDKESEKLLVRSWHKEANFCLAENCKTQEDVDKHIKLLLQKIKGGKL